MDIQKQADVYRRLEDSRELELCKQQLVSYESRCEVAESKFTSLNRRFSESKKVKNSQQQLRALRAEKQEALSRANVLIGDKKAELLDYKKQVQQAQERLARCGARTQVPPSPAQPNSGAAAPPPTPAGPSSHTEPRFGGNRVVLEAKLAIAEWKLMSYSKPTPGACQAAAGRLSHRVTGQPVARQRTANLGYRQTASLTVPTWKQLRWWKA